jgi:hypothetical protein
MSDLVKEITIVEDSDSPFVKGRDSLGGPLSEALKKGDGYAIFSPEGSEVGGTRVVLKWGGNPTGDNKQQDGGEKGEKSGNSGNEEGGQDQGGQEGSDSEGKEGQEGSGGSGGSSKEKGTQSDKRDSGGKGKGKGEKKGEDEEGESGDGGEGGEEENGESSGGGGGEKSGKEKHGKDGEGEKGHGRKKDSDSKDNGDNRGEGGLGDLDKISGQDILGGGRDRSGNNRRNRGRDRDGDGGGRPPQGPSERDKKGDKEGTAKDKSDKGKSDESGDRGEPGDDEGVEEISSDINNVPPVDEEDDPGVLDIIFNKDKKEVSEKENKIISKSFVYRSGRKSIEVFLITPKGRFSHGSKGRIRELADLVYYLYEPYLKAPSVDLDPGVPVIDTPVSSRGLRSERPHERPKISFGALSTLDLVDFSKLIVFIDVSGSMDMDMVSKVINSYFHSIFSVIRSRRVTAVVVLHGTNVGVFGITASSWLNVAPTIAGVAESSRGLVGMDNGSESILTEKIVKILSEVSPIKQIGQFIHGQVPLIWISDFYWEITPGGELTTFLRNKPALLISTVLDPEDAAKATNDSNELDIKFSPLAFGTARTIMSKVPYGALIYFPSFIRTSYGPSTPGSSSGGGSGVRVYAKGGAYNQLNSKKGEGKLGKITIVRIS